MAKPPRKRQARPPTTEAADPAIGASLKAEATARYSREHRTSLTGVIPEEVTRAKAGAWLDLISPLTQWAGRLGDRQRRKRFLEGVIYDEVVIDQIVDKATERLRPPKSGIIQPIPAKFVLSFLEQASREEPGSPLVDKWANLLASASEEFDAQYIHFVSILARLSSEQALLFQSMIDRAGSLNALRHALDDGYWYRGTQGVTGAIALELMKHPYVEKDGERGAAAYAQFIRAALEITFDTPALAFVYGSFIIEELNYNFIPSYTTYRGDQEVGYSILEAIGILRRVETGLFEVGDVSFAATYYHLTPLGFHLAKSCKMLPETSPATPTGLGRINN